MFKIDSDIHQAHTLSSDFYTDEKYFEEAQEKIFGRTWHLAGIPDETFNLKPFNILETPLILAKDDEKINCFSNVCTHRGAVLVENEASAKGIRCRYHGRRFDLKGKFLSMPEFENVENFPSEKDDLPKIPFGVWEKFVFASLNPRAPLNEFLAELQKTVKLSKNLQLTATKDYEINAHWALYCENYLEGFHVPFVHKSLNEAIDYGTYTTRTFRYSSVQIAYDVSRSALNAGKLPALPAAHYFFVFPNLMFNYYPWGLSLNIVKPINPGKTIVSYLTFVSDESKLNTGAGADLETVELEDQAIVESVQRGIRSSFYDSGRYSPTRERGTHHFHRLICEFMSN